MAKASRTQLNCRASRSEESALLLLLCPFIKNAAGFKFFAARVSQPVHAGVCAGCRAPRHRMLRVYANGNSRMNA
ncbi:hypothetical protein GN244_ATG02877 [Phytophthora infestans]|uniref:Uncharacterized protein n=1 Tax=Phytophthora infestans TaxID=4787 RepID=A0A833TJZ3_PHYIN|nr:hypothetical protein GN244_ATG02877 [Phytophthora infestans]